MPPGRDAVTSDTVIRTDWPTKLAGSRVGSGDALLLSALRAVLVILIAVVTALCPGRSQAFGLVEPCRAYVLSFVGKWCQTLTMGTTPFAAGRHFVRRVMRSVLALEDRLSLQSGLRMRMEQRPAATVGWSSIPLVRVQTVPPQRLLGPMPWDQDNWAADVIG